MSVRAFISRLLPPAVRRTVKRRLSIPETRLHEDWRILTPIGPVREPHVVFDVGSHAGWFFHCWKDWCPEAEVHAFEPQPDAIEQSRQLYGGDPRIRFNNVAVGSEAGSLDLRVMDDSKVSSSFLSHVPETWKAIDYHTGAITTIPVPVVTLDGYCEQNSIRHVYLMKIDVQGFELEVLKGAEQSLAFVDHVLVESAIRPLYENAPRFTHVFDYLDARGFHLMSMRAWHRGNHTLVETDMLFRRNDLMPPVDSSVSRIMEQV